MSLSERSTDLSAGGDIARGSPSNRFFLVLAVQFAHFERGLSQCVGVGRGGGVEKRERDESGCPSCQARSGDSSSARIFKR